MRGQLAGSDPARSDELPELLDRLRSLADPRRLRAGLDHVPSVFGSLVMPRMGSARWGSSRIAPGG
ncbi:hypothetical protein, partial [Streptomyces sp. NPDC002547]